MTMGYVRAPRGSYVGGNRISPRAPRTSNLTGPLTEAQASFIATLLAGRQVDAGIATGIEAILANPEATKKQGSDVIGYLKALPYQPRENAVEEVGFYEAEGRLFKVKLNRQATSKYAMVYGEHGWEYMPGAIHKLSATDKISDERAKQLQA